MASPPSKEPACASVSVGGPVDVEALIAAFLADQESSSLELPTGLSAEQRKAARRLSDQHPELKCESYGFGEERRLHLFKRGQDRVLAQTAAYHVKNTFIDDWSEAKGEEPAFRSMPPSMMAPSIPVDLLERTLQRCLDTNQEIREGSSGTGTPRSSTTAGGHDLARALDASPSSNADNLPPMPEGFKVRNTFIHIESVPVVERIVQSMPHGMFRQCLAAELQAQQTVSTPEEPASPSAEAAAPVASRWPTQDSACAAAAAYTAAAAATPCLAPPPAPLAPPAPLRATPAVGMLATSPPGAPPSAPPLQPPALPAAAAAAAAAVAAGGGSPGGGPPGEEGLVPGAEVIIQGLVKLPDFNGLTGVVQALDAATGRYDVLLDGPAGQCGWKWVKVKSENCRLKMPPPPQNAPTLAMDCLPDDRPPEGDSISGGNGGAVPKTPAWDEDFSCEASLAQQAAAPIKLNALI